MLIGAMNHPQHDVVSELEWMAAMGLDFVDLSLEPPAAAAWRIDVQAIRAAMERLKLRAVGHTAYYLPLASPFERIRQAAIDEFRACLEIFAKVGVTWVNVHPDTYVPMHEREFLVKQNLASLRTMLDDAARFGIGLMIENLPQGYNTPAQLGDLLDPFPELGLHLDIGHANLLVPRNTTAEILKVYGHRLRHVHLHDNKGGSADLHLPLGVGSMDVARQVKLLKQSGYDGTITLEVFTTDHEFLRSSMRVLRELWQKAG